MATNTFILWAPDYTDADVSNRRQAARSAHADRAKSLASQGLFRAGGPILTEDSANAAPEDQKSYGSCKIIKAESLQAARKLVEDDIYYTAGVWDKDKIQVLPFVLKTPGPLLA